MGTDKEMHVIWHDDVSANCDATVECRSCKIYEAGMDSFVC